MSDIEAYRALFGADLKKLPYGVLKAIQAAVLAELQKRRQMQSVEVNEARAAIASTEKHFVGLSRPGHAYNNHALKCLPEILDQDWSHLFKGGDPEKKYYVYGHFKPTGMAIRFVHKNLMIKSAGLPFYIGKGTGDRAFDLKRNQGHGETLRGLLKGGTPASDIAFILCDKLTEDEALELESKLIYFFGTKYESGRKGILVNLDIPPRPEMQKRKRKFSLRPNPRPPHPPSGAIQSRG